MSMYERAHGVIPEPSYTCPYINRIIAELEELRALNVEIRDWGIQWRDKALEYYAERNELQKRSEEMEDEIKDLRNQLS